jgi:YVTN family beta-propeller protein
VSFVDPIAALEIARVAIAGRPNSILVDPSGSRAFVTLERGNSIAVLRLSSRSVVASVPTEGAPFQLRFGGRNGETILVAHHESPYVTVLDSASLALRQRVYVGTGVRAIEVDRRSGKVFVARARTGKIEVFDGASLLPVNEFPVPGEVAWLAIESEGNGLAVLLQREAEARILSILGGRITTRAPLGPGPFAVRFLEAR